MSKSPKMANLVAPFWTIVLALILAQANAVHSLVSPSITAFKSEKIHTHNVLQLNSTSQIDIAKTGKRLDEIVQSANNLADLIIDRTNSSIPTKLETIEFKLKLRSNLTVFEVKGINYQGVFGIQTKPQFSDNLRKLYLSVDNKFNKFFMDFQQGFALWDMKVNQNISIPIDRIKLEKVFEREFFAYSDYPSFEYHLAVGNSTPQDPAYVSFMVEDSDSLAEQSFLLKFDNLDREASVEIYLTLDGETQGKKVVDIKSRTHGGYYFTSDFVYLLALGPYQYTFVVTSEIESGDDPLVMSVVWIRKISFNLNDDYPWWYNNMQLFDYSLESKHETDQFQLCDMMANCYPYDRSQVEVKSSNNETIYKYSLSEGVKRALSHSPVVRLKYHFELYSMRSGHLQPVPGEWKVLYHDKNKVSLSRIQAHLLEQKHQVRGIEPNVLEYSIKVKPQTRIELNFPTGAIDMHAQYIRVNITQKSPIPQVGLHLLGMKSANSDKMNKFEYYDQNLSISTNDYVYVDPWKMYNHSEQSFGIEFEVVHSDAKIHTDSMIELKVQFEVEEFDSRRSIPWTDDIICNKPVCTDLLDHTMYKKLTSGFFPPKPTGFYKFRSGPYELVPTKEYPRIGALNSPVITLIQSTWFPSSPESVLRHTEGYVEFRFNSTFSSFLDSDVREEANFHANITESSLSVHRIVIGSKQSFITYTPLVVQMTDLTSAIVVDDFKQQHANESIILNGPFRLAYAIQSKVPLTIGMTNSIKNPPQLGEKIQFPPNCFKGPTYGFYGYNCLYYESQCPEYYFKYDPIAKKCTRTGEPMHH